MNKNNKTFGSYVVNDYFSNIDGGLWIKTGGPIGIFSYFSSPLYGRGKKGPIQPFTQEKR